ncbi:MAG: NAD(P)-dependent oxidoreductase [Herbiconiux sp.]|nr:NAD(P)-dependent oxidoreductase [Herbiconiux sp.]
MRIFLAGGSGVLGTRLIPELVARGHQVTATTRRESSLDALARLGAEGVLLDVLRVEDVRDALAAAGPDVVMHLVTDLATADLAANGRIRVVGTDHLVDAARAAGVDRLIAQSVTWVFPDGDTPATEDEPIIPGTPVHHLESRVSELRHSTVLRFGMLYGPGTWYAPDGRVARAVRAGAVPATPAITSFVHVDDAVDALVRSLDWPDGTYHVVDDDPAAGTVWLPDFAAVQGGPPPVREDLPAGVPRGRAVSNAKAKAAGWRPAHPSWREGFADDAASVR